MTQSALLLDTDDVLADRSTFVDRLVVLYFVALGILIYGFRGNLPGWPQFLVLHFFGLATVFTLLFGGILARPVKVLRDWYPLAFFIVAFEEVALLSHLIVPEWQDGYLLAFETAVFPVPPTAWAGTISSAWLTELMAIGYFSYFVLFFLVGVPLYLRLRPAFHWMMSTLVLSYLLCYAVFIGFPTEGPRRTLAHLHTQPLDGGPFFWAVQTIQNNAGVHGNAFPSAHVAAGVICLLYAWRYLPRWRGWIAALVAGLCAGAVYLRYHYVSDVLGGIAIALLAWWLMRTIEKRPELTRRLRLPPLTASSETPPSSSG